MIKKFLISTISSFLFLSGLTTNTYTKNVHSTSKRNLHLPSSKKPLIWVYDIRDLSLIAGAPFKTKTECANILQINRSTVAAYLDGDKLFDNKWVFSSISLSKEDLSKWVIPTRIWEIITGELLGDGYLNYDPIKAPQINARLEFTFSSKILHYVRYLKYDALAFICTESEATAWPNPKTTGKEATQYWFSTKRLASITQLYDTWYKEVNGKHVKVLPLNIEELLTPLALAHWIMGDGYFADGSVKICTDNFTKEEVLILTKILGDKFGIKATINKRSNANGNVVWRVSISRLSMEKLRILVGPYLISEMKYKLGI